jgi:hypothetical protein
MTSIVLQIANASVGNTYVGAVGEVIYDSETNTIRVFDGSVAGGKVVVTTDKTANNTNFVGSVSAANVVSNSQLQANLLNYVTNTQFISNLASNLSNYVTNTQFNANIANYTTIVSAGATEMNLRLLIYYMSGR